MSELKKLIFAPPFPPTLLSGEKTKTFRVTGAERYNVGDKLSLVYPNGEEFARAVVSEKYSKTFETLTAQDWEGHERFVSNEEMYRTYSYWEGFNITPATNLTIVCYKDFKLIEKSRKAS